MNLFLTTTLQLIIFLPAVAGLLIIFLRSDHLKWIRAISETVFIVVLLLSFILYFSYDSTAGGYQFVYRASWIPGWGAEWHTGVDGIALVMILLTVILFPIAFRYLLLYPVQKPKGFIVSLLFLQSGIIGVFSARDMLMFYVFWELMLIPLYFLIGLWGEKDRIKAAVQFFIYTLAGSLLMLAAILTMYFYTAPVVGGENLQSAHSFAMDAFATADIPLRIQCWLFIGFALAFLIKAPLFPFHSWQPVTYAQSPVAVSILLAGILGKTAIYGLMRLAVPFFPEVVIAWGPYLMGLAVFTILFGALLAWVQKEIRYWIAYASLSHIGMMALGVFSLSVVAWTGVIVLMFSHGVIIAGVFILTGLLQTRTAQSEIASYGGLWKFMPLFGGLLLVLLLGMVGLPGTNGFIGEFLILSGTFTSEFPYATIMAMIAILSVIFSAVYVFRFFQQTMTGPLNPSVNILTDLKTKETLLVIPLIALIFLIGFYPALMTDTTTGNIEQHIRSSVSKIEQVQTQKNKKIQNRF